MSAGKLNKRITLQSPQEVDDGLQTKTVHVDVATVWAQIRVASMKDLMMAAQSQASVELSILIRKYPGLDSTWRFTYADADYAITYVDELSKRGYMILKGTRIV